MPPVALFRIAFLRLPIAAEYAWVRSSTIFNRWRGWCWLRGLNSRPSVYKTNLRIIDRFSVSSR